MLSMRNWLMSVAMFWIENQWGRIFFGLSEEVVELALELYFHWKIKLVSVPEIVTVFRIEKTLEQGATDIVHQWQYIADKIDENLFIRVVLLPVNKKRLQSIKAKFIGLFLGNAKELTSVVNENLPALGLLPENCVETSWIKSILFWSNYPIGTSMEVLLQRQPQQEKSSYLNYRDVDIGINENGNASYSEAVIWGRKYFKGNFDRLVQVKSKVDPGNFFRYEQSIPCLGSWKIVMAE
ncbi:UDP-glycosyltransferase 76F1-like [Hibiscus syriacus]|uniref:UDP-glycosyltransferase 76F1-like n=1 Tax=Hibiscus syriacus TaxID=106335 RepID=A0A6A2XDP6_HIBSY|nr:UDP-glycosyltransferase 76F1-like [Hibiscus syriacus]